MTSRLAERLRANKYVRDARTFPRAAADAWRRGGGKALWREARTRTIDRVWEQGRLWVVEQDLRDAVVIPSPPGVRIEAFEGAELDGLLPVASRATLQRFRRALARGRTCLVARRGATIVGYAWISAAIDPDLEAYPLPLPGDAAYLWDLHVVPEERNRGLGTALASARLGHAQAAGFRRGWRVVAPADAAALRTLERTGRRSARIVGEVTAVKLWRRRWAAFHAVPERVFPRTR